MAHVLGDAFERCIAPLADEPTGTDPKYDDDFVDLKMEIENIASGKVDWEKVETLALGILTEKAKDLYSMSYLAAALIQRHGFGGLADAVAILKHWMEADWDNLYPRRPARSRAFAFAWLTERITPYVTERELAADELPVLDPLAEDLQTIAKMTQDKLMHQAPSFTEMLHAIDRLIKENQPAEPEPEPEPEPEATPGAVAEAPTPAPEPEPEPAAPTPAPTPAAEAAPATEPAPVAPAPTTPEPAAPATPSPGLSQAVEVPDLPPLEDNASSRDIRDRIRALIAPLRQSQLLSPTPYLLLRTLKWQELKGSPPADPDSGKTRLPAPRKNQRVVIANLFEQKNWAALLEASEAAFQNDIGTFWLDLQFYSVHALESLDPHHGVALAAQLVDALRELLERFPNLTRLTYQDGTPFASTQTKQWIEDSVRKVEIEVVSFGSKGDDNVLEEDEIAQVNSLFESKDADAAMALLQDAIGRSPQDRAVFRTRLTAAQLCLQGGKDGWSRQLLDTLRQSMEGFRFESWEPELSTELYHLLALCSIRQLEKAGDSPDPEVEETLDLARGRLFDLDLRAAARIDAKLAESSQASGGTERPKQVTKFAQLFEQMLRRG